MRFETAKLIAIIYSAPVLFGVLISTCDIVGYKYFGVDVELGSGVLDLLHMTLIFSSTALCAFIGFDIYNGNKLVRLAPAFLAGMYAFYKTAIFPIFMNDYFGYSCCMDEGTTFAKLIELVFNPFAPYLSFLIGKG